jgi:hypothetical protein
VKASIQPAATAGKISGSVHQHERLERRRAEVKRRFLQRASKVTSRDCTTTATKHIAKVVCARVKVQKPRSKPIATNRRSSDNPVITSGMTSGA